MNVTHKIALALILSAPLQVFAAEVVLQTPPLSGKPLICSLVNATGGPVDVKRMEIVSIVNGVVLSASNSCAAPGASGVPDGSGCLVAKQPSGNLGDILPAYCRIVYDGPEAGVLAAMQAYSSSGDISAAVTAVQVTKASPK
jgi:hypothetical protein